MGTIKDRNGRDLVGAEEMKKRLKEYMDELYDKDLNKLDYYNSVVRHQSWTFWSVKSRGP